MVVFRWQPTCITPMKPGAPSRVSCVTLAGIRFFDPVDAQDYQYSHSFQPNLGLRTMLYSTAAEPSMVPKVISGRA